MKTVVVHSGGMDSSICLSLACTEFGPTNVLSLGFSYGQRHELEMDKASEIAAFFKVSRQVIDLGFMSEITDNALVNKDIPIAHQTSGAPNTLVSGRNGLMARVAAIYADYIGAQSLYMGVMELEEANSGYRDCSREYIDLVQAALRIDFANDFEIRSPLVYLNKQESMELVDENELKFLLETTISCYEGLAQEGCKACPACKLRNNGIREYMRVHPDFEFSYKEKIMRVG